MTARCLNNLGSAQRKLGNDEAALENLEAALALKQAMGDAQGEAQTWFNIGQLRGKQGNGISAVNAYEQARVIFESLGLVSPAERCRRAVEKLED